MGIINVFLIGKANIHCNNFKQILHLLLKEKNFWITFTETIKTNKERSNVCNKPWLSLIGIPGFNNSYILRTNYVIIQLWKLEVDLPWGGLQTGLSPDLVSKDSTV